MPYSNGNYGNPANMIMSSLPSRTSMLSPAQLHQVEQFDQHGAYRMSQSQAELTLSSFAALLSTAESTGDDVGAPQLLSSPEPKLAQFLSRHVTFDSTNPRALHAAAFPSLSLKNRVTTGTEHMSLEDVAALNLAIPVCVDRKTVTTIPGTLLRNVNKSFESLIESRLRSSMIALLRQVLKLGAAGEREAKVLKKLLSSKTKPISLTTIVTTFRVLPKTEAPHFNNSVFGASDGFTLPLVFEAVIDAKVLASSKIVTLKLSSPGMISGSFHDDGLLEKLEVAFDTIALLQSMMKQARVVVKHALNRAAGIASHVAKSAPPARSSPPKAPPQPPSLPQYLRRTGLSSGNLNGFSGRLQDAIRELNVEQANLKSDEEQSGRCRKRKRGSVGGHGPRTHEDERSSRQFALDALKEKSEAERETECNLDDSQGGSKKPRLFSWLSGDSMLLNEDEEASRKDNPLEIDMGLGFFARIAAQVQREDEGSETETTGSQQLHAV